jgi:hypothetical protein
MCNDSNKTFSHVFTCSLHIPLLHTIIFNHQHKLVSLINQCSKERIILSQTFHSSIWDYHCHSTRFTFIDLIKGFIPLFLSDLVHSFVKDRAVTLSILSVFVNNIYLDFMTYIWKPHCNKMLLIELHAGIDKKQKRKKKPLDSSYISDSSHPTANLSARLDGLMANIDFGRNWLQYYNSSVF